MAGFTPKSLLLLAGCIVASLGTLAALYTIENKRGTEAWESTKQDLHSSDVSLNFRESLPPKQIERNFADHPIIKSLTNFEADGQTVKKYHFPEIRERFLRMEVPDHPGRIQNWFDGTPEDMERWFRIFNPDQGKTMHPKMKAIKRKSNPRIDEVWTSRMIVNFCQNLEGGLVLELYQAQKRLPNCQLPHDIESDILKRYSEPVSFLADLSNFIRFLETKAHAQIDTKDPTGASESITLIFKISELCHSYPTALGMLVAQSGYVSGLRCIWHGMDNLLWEEHQLVLFESKLSEVDLLEGFRKIYHLEGLIYMVDSSEFVLAQDNRKKALKQISFTQHKFYDYSNFIPEGWFRMNLSYLVNAYHRHKLTPLQQRDFTALASQNYSNYLKAIPYRYRFYCRDGESGAFPNLDDITNRVISIQTSLILAACSCRIENYRMRNGTYPDIQGASELILPDPFNPDRSLAYKPDQSNDRYILYSVSGNGIDDGGRMTSRDTGILRIDLSSGDLCWRFSEN